MKRRRGCFDCGSGENSHTDTGNATMNAIEWGTACWFGGCFGTGPWIEADLENGMFHTNTGSNKDPGNSGVRCPDVTGQSTANGTPPQIWDCSGNAGERFTATSGKQLQVYGSKCLDASNQGTTNGTGVIIWDCNGGVNQQWTQRS